MLHDVEEAVTKSGDLDVMGLETARFTGEQQIGTPLFRRITAAKLGGSLKIEWERDSVWRFFRTFPKIEGVRISFSP